MKCTIPEIAWHNRDPVLSVDIQKSENNFYRLASGGTDCHILIWKLLILENGSVSQEVISDLTRHQRAVNVVRWSPTGQYLASGDDDSNIIVWMLKTDNIPSLDNDTDVDNKEVWNVFKILRGHREDVYDISWSPDESKLLTGSIDNTAILWDINKGKSELILKDHKGFVQGCAWDPRGQYLATLSSDRICRIFDSTGRQIKARIGKGKLPVSENHFLYEKDVKYFHDDTFKSYFRRLNFTPEGSLLVIPSGCVETEDCKKALNGSYIFTLDDLTQPVAILPSNKKCTSAVSCCPVIFELRPDGPDPIIDLPYRMVLAIATDTDLVLYDTQQLSPFAILQNIHYTRLTDLTWSRDGLILAASSTDGFCTLVTFDVNELGTPYTKEINLVEKPIDSNDLNEKQKVEDDNIPEQPKIEVKPKKPTILEQWAKKNANVANNSNEDTSKSEQNGTQPSNGVKKIVPKRIVPTRVLNQMEINGSKKEAESKKVKNDDANSRHKEKDVCVISKQTDSDTNEEEEKKTKTKIVPIKIGEATSSKKRQNKNSPAAATLTPKRKLQRSENSPKPNSLLNFLKSPKVVKEKPKKKTILVNKENTGSCEIIDISDEDEARDAWKVESSNDDSILEIDCKPSDNKLDLDGTQTDVPEDFILKIEDNSTKKENLKVAKENELSDLETDFKLNKETTNQITSPSKKEVSESSNSPESNLSTNVIRDMPKTPRRVPLITLSSPRHKKKRTT